jgi:hypothetical protein
VEEERHELARDLHGQVEDLSDEITHRFQQIRLP